MWSYLASVRSLGLQTLDIWLLILKHFVNLFVPLSTRYKSVKGEIVLVTGAGSGLGRKIAIEFARLNSIVVLCDVNENGNEETKKMIKEEAGEAYTYYCDVANRVSVYETAIKIKDEIGVVTILVNNAGILVGEDFLDIPDFKIQKTFEVNAMGPMWMCKAFLPDMIESNHGHIVNIASMGGLIGFPKLTDYAASKHALKGFNDSLKIELYLAGYVGIKTTLVCPSFFNSGLYKGYKSSWLSPEFTVEEVCKEIMSGVLTEREKILVPKTGNILTILQELVPTDVGLKTMVMLGSFDTVKNFTAGRVIEVDNVETNNNFNGKIKF